jgi:hypothetical protein
VLLFELALVARAGECAFGLLAQLVAPAVEHALGHAQVAGDLGHRRVAALARGAPLPA